MLYNYQKSAINLYDQANVAEIDNESSALSIEMTTNQSSIFTRHL